MKTAIKELREIRKLDALNSPKLLIPRKILLENITSSERLLTIARRFRKLPVIREFALLSDSNEIEVPQNESTSKKDWPYTMKQVVVYEPLVQQIYDCLRSAQIPKKDFSHCFTNAVKICAIASDEAFREFEQEMGI